MNAATGVPTAVSEGSAAEPSATADREPYTGGWSKLKSLDGTLRTYTFSVLTTLALGIALVYFDAEMFSRSNDDDEDEVLLQKVTAMETLGAAWRQILRALTLLLLCIVIGICAFFLIGINVYPFKAEQLSRHRRWLIFAFCAVVTTNTLVVLSMVTAQRSYNKRQERSTNYESGFAHYLLFMALLISTLMMDVLFLVVFSQNTEQVGQHEVQGWNLVRGRLSSIIRRGKAEEEGQASSQPSYRTRARTYFGQTLDFITKKTLNGITVIVKAMRVIVGLSKEDDQDTSLLKATLYLTIDISEFFAVIEDIIWESCLFQSFHKLAAFITWDFWKFLRTLMDGPAWDAERFWTHRFVRLILQAIDDTVLFWRDLGPKFRSWVDHLYDGIREDDQYKHSSWVLAAMCTSVVLLIYFGFGLSVQISGYLHKTYTPRRDCAVWSIENNGLLGDFVFRLAGFTEGSRDFDSQDRLTADEALTDVVCNVTPGQQQSTGQQFGQFLESGAEATQPQTLPTSVTDLQEIAEERGQALLEEADTRDLFLYRCSSESFSENPCPLLALINDLEESTATSLNETVSPTQVFHDHGIGRTIYVIDRLLRHLVWAIWIGLMVGLAVGLLSLLSVLAQYKRFSLAIRSGFFEDLKISTNLFVDDDRSKNIARVKSVVTERKWAELIEHYPMGTSVFFFGILVSTAVLQLVVFGGAVAILLSFIASIFDGRVFAILRPYLALLLAFIVTWALNGPFAQRVVSEGLLVRKYRVYHELTFLLFLLVYTAVHLVLGVFIALMRLVWVLLTSIACLNRLDQNLFPLLKGLDLGHKSFMSMVLMHHAFLSNADPGEQFVFSDLYDMILKMREEGQPPPDGDGDVPPGGISSSNPKGDLTASPKSATKEETKATSTKTVSFNVRENVEESEQQVAAYLKQGLESGSPAQQQDPNANLPHYLRENP